MTIPSPYNFVPLGKVFLPEWANKTSHDIPFSEGLSGYFKIEATSMNPVYVRNGGIFQESDRHNQNSPHQDFFKLQNGKYCIPGTSFKGMLRQISTIASFGKMANVNNNRYSIRDLYNNAYTRAMTRTVGRNGVAPQAKAGWITIESGKWVLTPCEYARIEQEYLENYANIRGSLGRKQNAESKYRAWNKPLNLKFEIDGEQEHPHQRGRIQIRYRKTKKIVTTGGIEGTLVFTGQPTQRQTGRSTKHMEFVFFNEGQSFTLRESIVENFQFVHSDDRNKPNDEWRYWKCKLENGKSMPVFYIEEDENIHSIGLAMMYRFPYRYSIHDVIKNTDSKHLGDAPDLAELMFGYTKDGYNKNDDSLKGRVQFGHLLCVNNPQTLPLVKTVLAGPKPTYYPNYILQPDRNDRNEIDLDRGKSYRTYMDNVKIRGWKRYIVRNDSANIQAPPSPTPDVATWFRPLPTGTKFEGTIHFHNLLPEELGALVWALTWGGDDTLRHNIGMAKPYGYGSIKVKIISCEWEDTNEQQVNWQKSDPNTPWQDHQNKYIQMMNAFTKNKLGLNKDWQQTDQIFTLKKMANPSSHYNFKLEYPKLQPNEFVHAKGKKSSRNRQGFPGKVLRHIERDR